MIKNIATDSQSECMLKQLVKMWWPVYFNSGISDTSYSRRQSECVIMPMLKAHPFPVCFWMYSVFF